MSDIRSRKKVAGAMLVAAALFLTGCVSGGSDASEESVEQNLLFGIHAADVVTGFDPSRAPGPDLDIDRYLYSYLIRIDRADKTNYVPDLAESWESSEDGLTFTFHLRDDAEFTGGYGPVTSDDVLFTFEHLKDEGSYFGGDVANIIDVQAPDEHTVVLTLAKPDPDLFYKLADTGSCYAGILSRKAVTELGADYPFNPVGSGPFVLDSYRSQDRVVLTRNEDYYGDPWNLTQIDFIFMLDPTARMVAFENGDVHLARTPTDPAMLERFQSEGYETVPGEIEFLPLYLNTSKPPLDDLRVRQALAYGIDFAAVNEFFSPMYEYTPPLRAWQTNMPGFEAAADRVPDYSYDPDKAKELLAEAGYPNGLDLTVILGNNAQQAIDAITIAQEQLKEAGINLSIETSEFGPYQDRARSGDFQIAAQRVSRGIEVEIAAQNYVSESTPDGAHPVYNYGYYKNPEVDAWNAEAGSELDSDKRSELYANIIEAVMTDLPVIPLMWGSPGAFILQENLDLGYVPDPIDNRYPFFTKDTKITG